MCPLRHNDFDTPHSRIDLSQTPFFCALEAVVRTLVQMDSISYALTIELNAPLTHHTHYTPKIFLFITHSLYFGEHVST